jgi:hypothetical protein
MKQEIDATGQSLGLLSIFDEGNTWRSDTDGRVIDSKSVHIADMRAQSPIRNGRAIIVQSTVLDGEAR